MFTGGITLPSTEQSQTGSGSSPSTDFLGQVITSVNSGSNAPQDSFDATAPRRMSTASPSQSPLHPLAPRWPLSTTDQAYVFQSFLFEVITQRNLGATDSGLGFSGPKTAEEVYGSVTKPYDYTEGYHFLMKVLPFRYVSVRRAEG